jgi:DNA-binding NtrC family response regulator
MPEVPTLPHPETEEIPADQLAGQLAFYKAWESLLSRISPEVCRGIHMDGFLRGTVSEIGRMMDLDRCNLMVYAENRSLKIDYEYLRDASLPSALNQEIPVKRDFLVSSAYKYEPYIVEDIAASDIHPVLRQLCLAFGTRSLLIVPIHLGEELLAFIGLHFSRTAHRWTAEEIRFIRSLSNHLAIAYQYARMYLAKEREVKISRLLLNLIDELHQQRSMDEILAFLLDRIMELVRADRAAFGHFDLQGREAHFSIRRARDTREEADGVPERLDMSTESPIHREIEKGRPVLISDDSSLSHDGYRLKKALRAGTILVAPLMIDRALFGIFVFLWTRSGQTAGDGDLQVVESILRQAGLYFERNQLKSEIVQLRRRLRTAQGDPELVGDNPDFRRAVQEALDLAAFPVPLLILGESGTGRSLLAETIHQHGTRPGAPFWKLPCRGLLAEDFRARLLGRVSPDAAGKDVRIPGLLESAAGGTLLVHGLEHLPPDSQQELLELLDNGFFLPAGSRRKAPIQVRFLFSADPAVEELAARGGFDPALWRQISRHRVLLPPLRQRPEDLAPLIQFFLDSIRRATGSFVAGLDRRALAALAGHAWPGNVRELRAVLEQAVLQADGALLTPAHFGSALPRPGAPAAGPTPIPFQVGTALEDLEKAAILQTLAACGGDKQKTARLLRIGRKTLYRKLHRYRDAPNS